MYKEDEIYLNFYIISHKITIDNRTVFTHIWSILLIKVSIFKDYFWKIVTAIYVNRYFNIFNNCQLQKFDIWWFWQLLCKSVEKGHF